MLLPHNMFEPPARSCGARGGDVCQASTHPPQRAHLGGPARSAGAITGVHRADAGVPTCALRGIDLNCGEERTLGYVGAATGKPANHIAEGFRAAALPRVDPEYHTWSLR